MKRAAASCARTILGHVGRGLAVILPLGASLWVLWWAFVLVDEIVPIERLVGREIRGLGLATVLVAALLVGLLTNEPGVRRIVRKGEGVLLKIPLFKLVYSTFRDCASGLLVKKRFDRPVLVRIGGGFDAEVIGFVTRENLESLGILGKVAVYFPQAYNIGGNVLLLPSERLTPIDADSALVLSFVVTGGIASADLQPDAGPLLSPRGGRPRGVPASSTG